MSTLSPNMNLVLSTIGVDSGLSWETNLNASLSILDGHNHSPGSGVQITPSGLNINTDLPINSNNLTLVRSLRFQGQSAALSGVADLGCLYECNGDLYFNDGSANQVRITQSGSVAGATGTITGLPSGTASASFGAGTFVFQSATATSAVLDAGSVILRNNTANSKGLTLAPPNAMGANYSLTLPSLPASQSFMTVDNSGTMSAPVAYPLVSSGIAAGAVTQNKLGPVNYVISSSSGFFNTTSTTAVTVTNLSVTITTTGRPVRLMMAPSTTTTAYLFVAMTSTGAGNFSPSGTVSFINGSTSVGNHQVAGTLYAGASGVNLEQFYSVSAFEVIDLTVVSAPGTYTYTVQVSVNSGSSMRVNDAKLLAMEL